MDHCCKVGWATGRYDITHGVGGDVDEYLLTRWTGKGDYSESSFSELRDWFNKAVIRGAFVEADKRAISSEIESAYEALTGQDEIQQEEVRGALREDGVNVDDLEKGLVSKSTMYRHITGCLEGEREEDESESDWQRDNIEFAKERAREKTENSLDSLIRQDKLDGGYEDVRASIFISCDECSTEVEIGKVLAQGFVCKDHKDASGGDVPEAVTQTGES